MGLFGTQKVNKGLASEAIQMVETYYRHRGLDPFQHELAGSDGCGWWLTEGSAKVYVFVQDSPNGAVLRVTSPIVLVPPNHKEKFYRHLLDLNANLSNCALSTYGEIVLVVVQRPTTDLQQEELDDLVWNVAYIADMLDNKLAEEFGCKMYTEEAVKS